MICEKQPGGLQPFWCRSRSVTRRPELLFEMFGMMGYLFYQIVVMARTATVNTTSCNPVAETFDADVSALGDEQSIMLTWSVGPCQGDWQRARHKWRCSCDSAQARAGHSGPFACRHKRRTVGREDRIGVGSRMVQGRLRGSAGAPAR
eukprot:518407-Pyramimonas_sp.AAC.1